MSQPVAEPLPLPDVELVQTDGEPLESDWHRLQMNLLIDVVTLQFSDRTDYFVGGNMFIYYSEEEARNRDFRGPDFFFVWGRPLNPPRPYWAVWKEGGRYPDMILELSSRSTAEVDRTIKKDIYETVFHTHEYFIYDPDSKKLQGWRLVNHEYQPIEPNEKGWLWCQELGAWIGTWDGVFQGKEATYLRLFDKDGNMLPQPIELAKEQRQRAEAERQRAEAAEAELQRLKGLTQPDNKKNGEQGK
jgi:Uma2 family endonuclease